MSFFDNYFKNISKSLVNVNLQDLISISEKIKKISYRKGKLWIAGNGGSAGMAGHVAIDFTKAAGIPCQTFHDPSLITCFANDYGYENWLAKCVENFIKSSDAIILISSSGKSQNIVNAAHEATKKKCEIFSFTGFEKDNPVSRLSNLNFHVPSSNYNVIEMSHHIWLVAIVDFIKSMKE